MTNVSRQIEQLSKQNRYLFNRLQKLEETEDRRIEAVLRYLERAAEQKRIKSDYEIIQAISRNEPVLATAEICECGLQVFHHKIQTGEWQLCPIELMLKAGKHLMRSQQLLDPALPQQLLALSRSGLPGTSIQMWPSWLAGSELTNPEAASSSPQSSDTGILAWLKARRSTGAT